MSLPEPILPEAWRWVALLAYVGVLFLCVLYAPWRRLADGGRQHLCFGGVVVVLLVWRIHAGVRPGLDLHLLGASALTLLLGARLAVCALSVVLALDTWFGGGAWATWGVNGLLSVALPVGGARALVALVARAFPRQLLAYLFANAYLGAAATMLAASTAIVAAVALAGSYVGAAALHELFPALCLLALAESFVTGLAITLLLIGQPQRVDTFAAEAGRPRGGHARGGKS